MLYPSRLSTTATVYVKVTITKELFSNTPEIKV